MKISLKAARINAELTQKQVAENLNLCRQTIINWENNKSKSYPNKEQLDKILKLYKIKRDNLKLN